MSKLLPRPPHPVRRRGLRILLGFAGIVLLVVLVLVAGFFFGRGKIGEMVAGKVGERLAEDGVFIGWQSADWLPGSGVRMHGLALYRDAAKRDRLALFAIVTASRTDRSELRWDKASFRTADTQVVLGSGAGETRLEQVDMLLHIEAGKADLSECHARLQGLRLEAKCKFAAAAHAGNAEALAAAQLVTQREGLFRTVNLDWLKSVKEHLKFQPEKDEPVLRMELRSLPDDRGMESTMTFEGANFRWRGQRWDFAQAAVTVPVGKANAKSPIELDHVRIGIAGRKAELAGAFDPTSRVIRVGRFESGIDVLALARALVPDAVASLSAVSTRGDWQISGAGEIPVDRPENFRWRGDVALDGDFVFASGETHLALQKPAFAVRVGGRVVSISTFKAGVWDGTIEVPGMQVHLPSAEKRLRFETQLILSGARAQSISESFNAGRKQAGAVPLDWTGAWRISAAGEIPLDNLEHFHWLGGLALDGDLVFASGKTNVTLQQPTFSVRVEEQVVSISDLQAGLWEGNLHAPKTQIHLPSQEKKLRVETQLTLSGAQSPSVRKSFSAGRKQAGDVPFKWKGAWRIRAAVELPMDQPENLRWNGDVALDGDVVYASGQTNIAVQQPAFSVRAEEQVVTISDFKAGLWEGSLTAPEMKIFLPAKEQKVRFETQLTLSGARAPAVRKSFTAGQKQPRLVRLNWKDAWRINLAGEVPVDQPKNFRWNGDAALSGDLVYASGATKVAVRKPAFVLRGDRQVVAITDLKAGLWEGTLSAPRTLVHLPSAKKKGRFETQVKINDARLQAIVSSFGSAQKEPGVVQWEWKGGGAFDPATFAGSGALSIGGAEFGRMPIVGPLHRVFDKLAPGFRPDEPSTLTVNHRMSAGTLVLDDLKLISEQVRVEARGTIDLTREYTKLTASGRLRKLPGLATFLLTFLLEFKGEGPVDDVRWRLKKIPGFNLFGKAAQKATRTDAEKAADRALKGLIELPGNLLPDK